MGKYQSSSPECYTLTYDDWRVSSFRNFIERIVVFTAWVLLLCGVIKEWTNAWHTYFFIVHGANAFTDMLFYPFSYSIFSGRHYKSCLETRLHMLLALFCLVVDIFLFVFTVRDYYNGDHSSDSIQKLVYVVVVTFCTFWRYTEYSYQRMAWKDDIPVSLCIQFMNSNRSNFEPRSLCQELRSISRKPCSSPRD